MLAAREGDGKTTVGLQTAKEILENYPNHNIYWLATEGAVKNTVVKMGELGVTDNRFQIARKSNGDFRFDFRQKKDLQYLDTLLTNTEKTVMAVFVDSLRGATLMDDNDSSIGKIMHNVNAIVCDKHKATLVYIHHFSKSDKKSLLDKITGTTAATAAVRHILTIERKSKLTRIIKVAKSNIDDMLPVLEVVKQNNRIVIYEPDQFSDDTLTDKAEEFLTNLFTENRKLPAADIYKEGEEKGLSVDSLKRAKKILRIKTFREEGKWYWEWAPP